MNKNTFWGIICFILIAIALISLRQSVNFQSDGYHDELSTRQQYQAEIGRMNSPRDNVVSSDMMNALPVYQINSDNNVGEEEETVSE